MEYPSTVWGPVYQKQIQLLEQLLRTARYVFNNYSDRQQGCVTQMVKDLQWETLEERRRSNRLCMLYRIASNLVDTDHTSTCDLRTRGLSSPPTATHSSPRTIREKNALPTSVTEATSLEGLDIYCLQPHQSNNQPQHDDVYSLTMYKDQTARGGGGWLCFLEVLEHVGPITFERPGPLSGEEDWFEPVCWAMTSRHLFQ